MQSPAYWWKAFHLVAFIFMLHGFDMLTSLHYYSKYNIVLKYSSGNIIDCTAASAVFFLFIVLYCSKIPNKKHNEWARVARGFLSALFSNVTVKLRINENIVLWGALYNWLHLYIATLSCHVMHRYSTKEGLLWNGVWIFMK